MPAVRSARAWARLFPFAAVMLALGAHLAVAQAPAAQPAEKAAEKPAEKAAEKPTTGTGSGDWKVDADTFEGLRCVQLR